MLLARAVVFTVALAAIVGGCLYFRRFTIHRPPLGIFNLRDVAAMSVGIVALPYL